jgi:PAS domain S-box-containing protein
MRGRRQWLRGLPRQIGEATMPEHLLRVEQNAGVRGTFLQTVIDAIPDVLLVIRADYRIVLANRAAREAAGGIDPTAGLTCHQLSHHRDLPCTGNDEPCPLRQVVATKAPVTVMHTHYGADGKQSFVEISAAPVLNEAGEVDYIIEVCRDVSDRKRAEESLAQEHNLLRTLIDNLPDLIYVKDATGRFVAANLATALSMGATSPSDLLGKTDRDFYPAKLAAEYRADEEKLLRSGEPLLNKDEPHVDPTGNPRTISTSKVPLRDGQGNVTGLVGISRDVTERKQAEETLRLTQFSVDHAADPVFWVAPDARLVYANAKACERLGYPSEELLSLTVHDIDPDFPAAVWPQHWEDLKRRGSATFESRHRTKDGKLFPVEITVNYLAFAGKEYNCASARDISDRKRAEEDLRKSAEELARSNRDLEHFAAVASHDLQEPLRTVAGFVELLRKEYGPRLDEEAGTYIGYAVEGVARMQRLIEDLLIYARVGSRGREPSLTDAGAALRQALGNLHGRIQETGAEMIFGDLPTVRADASQLTQLFQNLLSNALKFRSQAPPRIQVEACRDGDCWQFSVRDNGIGIDGKFREQIFEIFRRLHTHKQYDGTGVGLAICKRIVERHGGRIWVESQPGEGATFCFKLPA